MGYTIKRRKINRIRLGAKPRVLDLFSGCGGISLGFYTAGYRIVGSIESDKQAVLTHASNFFKFENQETIALHSKPHDIRNTTPGELIKELGLGGNTASAVDIIVGGPPCQAYSRVGRAKLREIHNHEDAFLNDPRAGLYHRYLEYVSQLQPLALLMENVPDMTNQGGRNLADEICSSLTELGYKCSYTLLNAAHYGIPQTRDRLFLMAFAEELGTAPSFPDPTHWIQLPSGYQANRRIMIKKFETLFGGQDAFYTEPPTVGPDLLPVTTVSEAISDLPVLTFHLEGLIEKGIKHFDRLLEYPATKLLSSYARLMRSWPGFENHTGVYDHVLRYLPRDYPIFKRMNPGDEYPDAYRCAMEIFKEKLKEIDPYGTLGPGNKIYEQIKKTTVPPYDANKFPNKWRKLEPDKPARTLMAHLSRDGYSHIHYDSSQARTITPREAARLQSFPDGFVFKGSMQSAFSQIGNAVPPLLAYRIAVSMSKAIGFEYDNLSNDNIIQPTNLNRGNQESG